MLLLLAVIFCTVWITDFDLSGSCGRETETSLVDCKDSELVLSVLDQVRNVEDRLIDRLRIDAHLQQHRPCK